MASISSRMADFSGVEYDEALDKTFGGTQAVPQVMPCFHGFFPQREQLPHVFRGHYSFQAQRSCSAAHLT